MIKKKYLLPTLLTIIPFISLHSGSFLDEDKLIELAGRTTSETGKLQIENEIEYFKAKNNYSLLYDLEFSYGFNDKLGIEVSIPYFIQRKVDGRRSHGLSNIFVELEWTFFKRESNLALFTFGVELPSGHKDKIPPVETGSVGAIFEFDAIHADDRWYAQANWGAIFNSRRKHDTKIGNLYFYDLSFGARYKRPCSDSSYFFILEMSGFYFERDRFRGINIEETGASLVMLGPLVSWTRKGLLLQGLLQFPIGEHVFDRRRSKVDLRAGLSFQVTI